MPRRRNQLSEWWRRRWNDSWIVKKTSEDCEEGFSKGCDNEKGSNEKKKFAMNEFEKVDYCCLKRIVN